MILHLPSLRLPMPAPLLAGAVALGARWSGERLRRPVPRFLAGGAGLVAGWGMLGGVVFAPGNLAVFAAAAILASALAVRTSVPAMKGRRPPPPQGRFREEHIWLGLVALFGGIWLGTAYGAVWPAVLGAAVIVAAGLLAVDEWDVAAAAVSLWGAFLAVGAGSGLPTLALVVVAACLGGAPLLPLAAGLGGVMAAGLEQSARGRHPAAILLAVLAPIACLLLQLRWRGRFTRFGRAASPLRAMLAAGLVCLVAFSAAAMEGLR